jgi:hypothetical protein
MENVDMVALRCAADYQRSKADHAESGVRETGGKTLDFVKWNRAISAAGSVLP